jgi:hypothetical protein
VLRVKGDAKSLGNSDDKPADRRGLEWWGDGVVFIFWGLEYSHAK